MRETIDLMAHLNDLPGPRLGLGQARSKEARVGDGVREVKVVDRRADEIGRKRAHLGTSVIQQSTSPRIGGIGLVVAAGLRRLVRAATWAVERDLPQPGSGWPVRLWHRD